MIPTINCRQDTSLQEPTEVKHPFLPDDEPNLCNSYMLKNLDYIDRFCINFPYHCVLGQVPLDTNLLNNVDLWKEFVQPAKKPRSVCPHKPKPEKTISKRKIRQKNKKLRSVNIQIPEKSKSVKINIPEPEESRSGEEAMTPQRLDNVDGDPKNRSSINSVASIHSLFDKDLLAGLMKLDKALKIEISGKPIHLSQT